MKPAYCWTPLLKQDLDEVNRIADDIHTSLPERPEVFAEKVELSPATCMKLTDGARMLGYGISHPWSLFNIPPLDDFLGKLPEAPDCVYLHDIVIRPEARGSQAAAGYVRLLEESARTNSIRALALVSVYGTDILWSRLGFKVKSTPELNRKLSSYGPSAKYMIRQLQ